MKTTQKSAKKSNDSSVITMTTTKPRVILKIAGEGEITIDWGDGAKETKSLRPFDVDFYGSDREYAHNYSDDGERTIKIEGGKITNIKCSNNKLSSLDVSRAINLIELMCSENEIVDLDLTYNVSLRELFCSENRLENLDISNNHALEVLDCNTNFLKGHLDISNNKELVVVNCNTNNLTGINTAGNLKLKFFRCDNNRISQLDLTKNAALLDLQCSDNQLQVLSVSENANLLTLKCSHNLLENLSVNKGIKELSCHNNHLSNLDVADCENLDELTYHSNKMSDISQVLSGLKIQMKNFDTEKEASNKFALSTPLFKIEGGRYEIYLVEDNGKFYLSDEGATYQELDRIFELKEQDVVRNLKAILQQYNCHRHKENNSFRIECTPKDAHIKLSYLTQCLSFMLNMKIFYV
ncbi:MAG: DUF1828 domain-containing protein [Lentimicrobiaceae bacterium]|nr:DUF1828 domain-containing protein [Lentimicrobiaceae bacterium]